MKQKFTHKQFLFKGNEKSSTLFKPRFLSTGLFLMLLFGSLFAQAPSHDPSTMIRNNDGRYWIFTTGDGIWCMSSSNTSFNNWQQESAPFSGGYPRWISNYVNGFSGFFWAPDVIKIGNTYFLYYSCAGNGAAAAIGLATAPDLRGPWTDRGMVVAGNNAIDPALYMDEGRLWMAWGNWQSGIDIVELSTSTGKTISGVTKLVDDEVEGPGLIRNGDYYYLFYQRGLCCNGLNSSYYMVVARSTSITGPYTEERVFLPNRRGNEHGPGHFSYAQGKLTYHYYAVNDNGNAKLAVKTLGWNNGWPVASGSGGWESASSTSNFSGTYRLVPYHSGKVLEVAGNSGSAGANVQQWSSNGVEGQQWQISNVGGSWHRISPLSNTNMSLEVENASTTSGANVMIYNYLGGSNQQWQFRNAGNGYYYVMVKNSGKCLDVVNFSTDDGANISQYPYVEGFTNQMFKLEPVTNNVTLNGTYAMVAAHSGKAIDVYDWGTSNGTNINQWSYFGSEAQQFNINSVDNQWHRITPVIATDKALDVEGISTANGANINLWEYWGGNGQQFRFESTGDGYYKIINRNSEKCIDVDAVSSDDGANIFQWSCIDGAANQKFRLVQFKNGKTNLQNTPDQEIEVFPNPVTSYLNITSADEELTVKIYDQSGRLILNEVTDKSPLKTLNVSNLMPGKYIIQLKNNQQITTKTFIKQ